MYPKGMRISSGWKRFRASREGWYEAAQPPRGIDRIVSKIVLFGYKPKVYNRFQL